MKKEDGRQSFPFGIAYFLGALAVKFLRCNPWQQLLPSGREEAKCRQVLGETAGEQRDQAAENFNGPKHRPVR